ncbi:uncharacterized protein LOC122666926 isoform X2 [Telopea speciosissima]|uniref:uncharacterized protein LOC122666926 isoform X2 n=1 Tax=Telopea speciosissima TaxID=54955 RepID=UPI001CC5CBA1|nr:uncharacterized protein LOC122666926 isoform X2 [Telopea speciosissima]
MDLSTEVKSPPCVSSVDYTVVHPLTSVMDTTDSSVKLQNTHPSHAHHHYNLSRAMFLRRSCHKYGNRYSWRNSGCHADTLSTLCKGASPLCDEKLSFKFASRCSSESGYHGDCLEQRTSEADRWDPPCPLCVEWPSKVDASRGQE